MNIQTIALMLAAVGCYVALTKTVRLLSERHRRREREKQAAAKDNSEKARIKKEIGTMDRILVIIGLAVVLFIVTMIVLYVRFQSIPDVLCTCVFALCGLECGVMGKIQTNKERLKQKQWELESKGVEKND